MIKRILVGAGIAVAIAAGSAVALNRPVAPTVAVVQAAEATGFVAEGRVVPQEQVNLTFAAPGLAVTEVMVTAGDMVTVGQPLATLDSRALVLQVEQAKAQLAQAQAGYDALITPAAAAEVARARAQVAQAQAQVTQAQGGVTSQDKAAAQAQVAQAQAALNEVQAGAKQTDITRARAALDRAQATLQAQTDSLSAAKTNATLAQSQAADALTQAQSRYATAKRNAEHVQATGNDPATGRSLDDIQKSQFAEALVQTEAALRTAESSVAQAGVALAAAQQAEISGIVTAQTAVRDAQASLDALLTGADASERATARAQLAQAQANLARLNGEQRTGNLEAAAAGVAQAQASLDSLLAAPKTAEAARAKAQIDQATVAVKSAELALENATLRAPGAGSVAEINLTVGEVPAAQQAAIVLASTTWKIETTDLTELQVVKLKVGDKALLNFDALPDVKLNGTVTTIDTIGESSKGDIVYTVAITPEQPEPRLRWNMTAAVVFGE